PPSVVRPEVAPSRKPRARWSAAATSYSVHGLAMLPFYIYYSMFGFQRVGDAIWAAADQRARGFLLGATSGRTTLGGEGLQHQDGSSHLVAATIPNCRAWDPAFAGEMALIVDHGMRRMLHEQQDEFFYITLMNENYAQPDLPAGATEGVVRGGYLFERVAAEGEFRGEVSLLGSGAILTEVRKAARLLAAEGIASSVFSITSWSELMREGQAWELACEQGRDAAQGQPQAGADASGAGHAALAAPPYVATLLEQARGPVIAASDYVRAVPESIRAYVPEGRAYVTLGTDGFGRSDTRAALRTYFGVDAGSIAQAARRRCARRPA
ncbi:MAG: transketolase-like TK C-terminal-containing protein, partial [Rubrivivax sp.]